MTNPTPPADDRAETQLVSALAVFPDFWPLVRHVRPDEFRLDTARQAWGRLKETIEGGVIPDPADYVEFHDPTFPVAAVPPVVKELAGRISHAAYCRAALRHCSGIAKAAYLFDTGSVQRMFAEPPQPNIPVSTLHTAVDIAGDLYDEVDRPADILRTGLDAFDRSIGGLERSTATVLMARPSMGKTAALVQISDLVASAGQVVAVFSKEMKGRQWVRRMAARRAGVSVVAIKEGKLTADEKERYTRELTRIMSLRQYGTLFVDDHNPQTADEVWRLCEAIRAKAGRIDLVIADHLRLFADDADNETHRLGRISWTFKQIANELDTRTLYAAQINRDVEKQGDKRPDLKDLRDSGMIEENADNVVGLYREHYYNDDTTDRTAEFISCKARDGVRNQRSTAVYVEHHMSFERVERRVM